MKMITVTTSQLKSLWFKLKFKTSWRMIVYLHIIIASVLEKIILEQINSCSTIFYFIVDMTMFFFYPQNIEYHSLIKPNRPIYLKSSPNIRPFLTVGTTSCSSEIFSVYSFKRLFNIEAQYVYYIRLI